jgi:RNA polymerase sigma-70 factor, ECF subfamily
LTGSRKEQTDELLPVVYQELHRLARSYVRRENAQRHSLSPTLLLNEAYIELTTVRGQQWVNREHFLGVAALAMRRVLTTYARQRRTAKRAGRSLQISIEDPRARDSAQASWDYDELDAALTKLEAHSAELSEVVVCRFFGGMSVEETGSYLKISPATVKRRWTLARAWLLREMSAHGPEA